MFIRSICMSIRSMFMNNDNKTVKALRNIANKASRGRKPRPVMYEVGVHSMIESMNKLIEAGFAIEAFMIGLTVVDACGNIVYAGEKGNNSNSNNSSSNNSTWNFIRFCKEYMLFDHDEFVKCNTHQYLDGALLWEVRNKLFHSNSTNINYDKVSGHRNSISKISISKGETRDTQDTIEVEKDRKNRINKVILYIDYSKYKNKFAGYTGNNALVNKGTKDEEVEYQLDVIGVCKMIEEGVKRAINEKRDKFSSTDKIDVVEMKYIKTQK